MKYFVFIAIFLISIISNGQDSVKHLSKSSISFVGGLNIVYPSVRSYRIIENEVSYNYYLYSNYLVMPATNVNQWFSFSYNLLIHKTGHFSIGSKFGIEYTKYEYSGTGNGYDYVYNLGPPSKDSGTFQVEKQINVLEIDLSINLTVKLLKNVIFYNEINLAPIIPVFSSSKGNTSLADMYFGNMFRQVDSVQARVNLFLSYRTGLTFCINNNLSFTPLMSFPLLQFTGSGDRWNMFFNQIKPFNFISTGIMLTYVFDEK